MYELDYEIQCKAIFYNSHIYLSQNIHFIEEKLNNYCHRGDRLDRSLC